MGGGPRFSPGAAWVEIAVTVSTQRLRGGLRPRVTKSPISCFPPFPISPGNWVGTPDSRLCRNRESGNPRLPIRLGTGNGAPIGRTSAGNRGALRVSTAGTILGWKLP
jgi:hypothetical protein